MTTTKLKLGIISAVLVAGVATPLVIQHQAQVRLREKDEALRQQTGQLARLTDENQGLSNLVLEAKSAQVLSQDQLSELVSSGRESATLRDRVKELETVKEHLRGLQINSQWLNSLDEVELEVALARGDGTTYVQRPKLRRVGGEWQLESKDGAARPCGEARSSNSEGRSPETRNECKTRSLPPANSINLPAS